MFDFFNPTRSRLTKDQQEQELQRQRQIFNQAMTSRASPTGLGVLCSAPSLISAPSLNSSFTEYILKCPRTGALIRLTKDPSGTYSATIIDEHLVLDDGIF